MTISGYGTEMWCDERGLRTDRMVRGSLVVIQAIRRRLATEPSTLQGMSDADDFGADYGFSLPNLIGMVGYASAIVAVPAIVRAEIMKDDRVANVEAVATIVDLGAGLRELRVPLTVTLHGSAEVFPLTLAVSEAGARFVGTP